VAAVEPRRSIICAHVWACAASARSLVSFAARRNNFVQDFDLLSTEAANTAIDNRKRLLMNFQPLPDTEASVLTIG